MRFEKWGITGWLAVALVAMCAAILAATPTAEDGVRMVLRATARTSHVFLMLAFAARPLRQLWRSDASRWLLANRRYVGNGVTVSHGLHLAAILALPMVADVTYGPVNVYGGGSLIALIFVLGVTSNDAAVKAMGSNWKRLHRTGMWILVLAFTGNFAPPSLAGMELKNALGVGLGLAAISLRVAAWLRTRRPALPAAG